MRCTVKHNRNTRLVTLLVHALLQVISQNFTDLFREGFDSLSSSVHPGSQFRISEAMCGYRIKTKETVRAHVRDFYAESCYVF